MVFQARDEHSPWHRKERGTFWEEVTDGDDGMAQTSWFMSENLVQVPTQLPTSL